MWPTQESGRGWPGQGARCAAFEVHPALEQDQDECAESVAAMIGLSPSNDAKQADWQSNLGWALPSNGVPLASRWPSAHHKPRRPQAGVAGRRGRLCLSARGTGRACGDWSDRPCAPSGTWPPAPPVCSGRRARFGLSRRRAMGALAEVGRVDDQALLAALHFEDEAWRPGRRGSLRRSSGCRRCGSRCGRRGRCRRGRAGRRPGRAGCGWRSAGRRGLRAVRRAAGVQALAWP